MIVYKKKSAKKQNKNVVNELALQIAGEIGYRAGKGLTEAATAGLRGIVSAFRKSGASQADIRSAVVPLARTLSYGSKSPKYIKVNGGIMIEHIEQMNVAFPGHTAFRITTDTFQWLKSIANNFEEYKMDVIFAWNPICPATVSGAVMMAFDYDADDSGGYDNPNDYFNTQDHCVASLWSPAAIHPTPSVWLKTGSIGESRLYSPGTFHVNTDPGQGFISVKYKVSLRKPQPSANSSTMTIAGFAPDNTHLFGSTNNLTVYGDLSLVDTINPDSISIANSPGYKTIVWSTDGNLSAMTMVTASGLTLMGTKNGAGSAIVVRANRNSSVNVNLNCTGISGGVSYKCVITSTVTNPLYY